MSASTISSSASRGCNGKDAGFVLHVLMAQVRKLRVRSFISTDGQSLECGFEQEVSWSKRKRGANLWIAKGDLDALREKS